MIASAALPVAALAKPSAHSFLDFAPRPPLGWNSWDSFGATLNETQAREIAAIMAKRLLPHGYDTFTVDIQWYEPGATGFEYRKGAPLTMDEWGRLLPAPNRFPSSTPLPLRERSTKSGEGFRPLADYVHSLGLRFGVHLMRGIPRQAAQQRLPIRGTKYTADQIADRANVCEWNSDMYGIDMSKPGAQAYYDSVFQLLAEWHVDFVKVDDMSRPYERNRPEVEAVRTAIDRCGRPMVLSLSPGETPLTSADHVRSHANLWRISDDFWDHWPALVEQFERLARWAPYRTPGAWPDADMLPLGLLDLGKRHSNFTRDEQYTLMTLWSIARSPLIMGGDLRALDDFTVSLLTNDEVLAVDQRSEGNRQLWRRDDLVAWTASAPHSRGNYLALFNLRDASEGAELSVPLADLDLSGPVRVRDLWQRQWIGTADKEVTATLPPHGAALLLLR